MTVTKIKVYHQRTKCLVGFMDQDALPLSMLIFVSGLPQHVRFPVPGASMGEAELLRDESGRGICITVAHATALVGVRGYEVY